MTAWWFVTLVLNALALGAPLGHALEMPVRRTYDPALYVTVTHTLYFYFGTVGAVIEVGAILCAMLLSVLVWRQPSEPRPALRWVVTGAASLLLAHALWWLLIFPVNQEFATWTPNSVPVDWTQFRDRWEPKLAVLAVSHDFESNAAPPLRR